MKSKIAIALMLALSCVLGFSVGWTLEKRHSQSRDANKTEGQKLSPEQNALAPENPSIFTVDYSKSISQLVSEANLHADSSVDDKSFTKEQDSGKADLNFVLFRTREPMNIKDLTAEMDKKGLRPATLKELLAFSRAFPDKQKESAICEIGSIGEDSERCPIAVFLVGFPDEGNLLKHDYAFKDSRFGGHPDVECILAIVR